MGTGKTIEEQPSWVVVNMLFAFLVISVFTEHFMEWVHEILEKRHSDGLLVVHHKVKDELMLMGFISLILVVLEDFLLGICIEETLVVGVPCFVNGLISSSSSTLNTTAAANGARRRLLLGARDSTCPSGQTKLLSLAAIHHIHILIFVIAVCHITYSCILIVLSQFKMNTWADWETFGDDPKETIDLLISPPKNISIVKSFFEQFVNSVDAFGFMCLRRFYISKNGLKSTFEYGNYLKESLEHDYHEFVGISWWMWLILMLQTLAEGYGLAQYSIFAIVGVIFSLFIGTRCRYLLNDINKSVYQAYDGSEDHVITQQLVDNLQHASANYHKDKLDHIELRPAFGILPFFTYKSFKFMIRFVMFQNSSSLSQALFYQWQIGNTACYFGNRNSILLTLQIIINLFSMLHMSLVTVPLYCVYSNCTLHDESIGHSKKKAKHKTKILMKHHKSYRNNSSSDVSSKVSPAEDDTTSVTANSVMHVTELFQKFDSDHDGHITYDELKTMWEQMASMYTKKYPNSNVIQSPTDEEAATILASLDDDDNGSLEKSEFVDWISMGMTRTRAERAEYAESGDLQKKINDFLTLVLWATGESKDDVDFSKVLAEE